MAPSLATLTPTRTDGHYATPKSRLTTADFTRCGASDDLPPSMTKGITGVSSMTGSARTRRFLRAVSAALTIAILTLFFLDTPNPSENVVVQSTRVSARSLQHAARAVGSTLLEVFQVYPPVLTVTPSGVLEITDGSANATVDIINNHRPSCQQTLVVRSFGYSYGDPSIANYTPPACAFNRVTWNLTVTSAGRQFDRLGIVYLGDVEVFRTSTAEPTAGGIQWTYLKDMTSFLSLLREPQRIIFDLGNLINDIYTAPFNVTLTAAYFTAEDSVEPAHLIVPVSSRQSSTNEPSVFNFPDDVASNVVTLPRNIQKAVFTIAATGQSAEEFWWSNVPSSLTDTFPGYGTLYGYSPFREVQVWIDGTLAGVAFPFPIIFTGGVVPGLWRPIVGIDAFDLKEDEIDITPWLPILCDGNPHNFTLRVSGLNDDGSGTTSLSETIGSYWLITGKIFVWLDQAGHITTGEGPTVDQPEPRFQILSSIGTTANGTNSSLYYEVHAKRSLSYTSTINTSKGKKTAFWKQDLSFSNTGNYTQGAFVEVNNQHTAGFDRSSSGYAKHYDYSLYAYSVETDGVDTLMLEATVNHGKTVQTLGKPVFPTGLEAFAASDVVHPILPSYQGSSLSTTQEGNATYRSNTTTNQATGFGTTVQDMNFAGIRAGPVGIDAQGFPSASASRELFSRHARAVNGTVVEDDETLVNTRIRHDHELHWGAQQNFALTGVSGRGKKGERRPPGDISRGGFVGTRSEVGTDSGDDRGGYNSFSAESSRKRTRAVEGEYRTDDAEPQGGRGGYNRGPAEPPRRRAPSYGESRSYQLV